MSATYTNPPAWASGSVYAAGINEVTAASVIYLCTKTGTSGTSVEFVASFGTTSTDNNGQTWVCVSRGREPWQPNYAYNDGSNSETTNYPFPDQVVEDSGTELWQCLVSGTSGNVQPSWNLSPPWSTNNTSQPTQTDGTVTWVLVGYNGE
jgi:hypothetical protein